MRESRGKRLILMYLGIGAVCLALLILVKLDVVGLRCFFRDFTGLRCPGCGNTNGVLAVFSGDLLKPMEYNLLFYPEMALLIFILFYLPYLYVYDRPMSKFVSAVLVIFAIILIVWGIVRNILKI